MSQHLLEIRVVMMGLLLSAAGCGTDGQSASPSGAGSRATFSGDYPYQVVATCGMVTNIVQEVAGDRATVIGLMGEDVDPHLYKPTRADVKRLTEADVIFYSGLMLEGRMGDTLAKVGRTGRPVYAVTEGIDKARLREPKEFKGHWDPHVWMDVDLWSECVGFVATALSEFDPDGAAQYEENAKAYRAELKALDAYVFRVIASIPEDQRVLVTAHDAFGYFSDRYKIPVRSVQGISTDTQASLADINDLVSFVVDQKIKAIFVETSVNPRNIEAIIEGAGRLGWKVEVGGHLFSDAMGRGGTYEGTYIGMMDHNATTIARALGGKADKAGLHGRLSPHEP